MDGWHLDPTCCNGCTLHRGQTTALERQREAVARWRAQMDALQGNVGGLSTALQTLQARLGTLDGQVQDLNASAAQLDAQADLLLQASAQTR